MIGVAIALIVAGVILLFIIPWVGIAVGIVTPDTRQSYFYGTVKLGGQDRPPDAATNAGLDAGQLSSRLSGGYRAIEDNLDMVKDAATAEAALPKSLSQ